MSTPQEHDYIGLSEPPPLEKTSDKLSTSCSSSKVSAENEGKRAVLNLKETELRLGLPGSKSPERKSVNGVSLFGTDLKDEGNNGFSQSHLKGFVSGAKRGFSDVIFGCEKWGLCVNGASEVDFGKNDVLFSPRGMNGGSKNGNNLQSCLSSVKEIGSNIPVKPVEGKKNENGATAPASKAQIVGWPPIRSFRKNTLTSNLSKNGDVMGKSGSGCLYVKVSLDGAPYLRKIDLKIYGGYAEVSSALEKMFTCFTIGQYGRGLSGQEGLTESCLNDLLHGSEYVLTYKDKDGDWMLVGDVPWEMFTDSCKRLRIMKSSEAIGLAPRTMEKYKSQK
ncbi:auxin-responsive protein IAA27-like [Primulina tabacum]|uniref:auxin-responsive protein IAA27-like n=1 Tax=Primulina tabacum TaxID=48773 RepID=UPI003F5A2446